MSPILIVLGVAVLAGFLARGSLRGFGRLRLHWWALASAGLFLQAVPAPASEILAAAMLIGSYGALLAFALVNRRRAGTWLVLLGLALNLAVIAPNGGMPVSAEAIRTAGGHDVSIAGDTKHHLMSRDDVLRPLGDVIAVPRPVGVILSIGDVALYVGIAWFVIAVMLGLTVENSRPPAKVLQMYRGKHLRQERRLPARYRRSPQVLAPAATGRRGTAR